MAGLALASASAVALSPVVIQEQPRPTFRTSAAVPAIQLAAAASPQEIIDTLQGAVDTAVTGAAAAAMFPADALVSATLAAQNTSFEVFNVFINAANNPAIKALLTGLQGVQFGNLNYLVNTADDIRDTSQFWVDDGASLIQDTANEAIAAAVNSVAGVLSNPLAVSSYTSLLGAGVKTAFDSAGNAIWFANDLIQAPLDLIDTAFSSLAFDATYSVAAWSDFIAATLTSLAAQTGLPFIQSLTQGLLALTTTPLSILAAGLGDVAYWTPAYPAVIVPEQITYAVANVIAPLVYGLSSIGDAITTIGADPLNPASYVTSLQGFVTAGFNAGSEAIWSANQVAQIAPFVFDSVVNPIAIAADSLTSAVAYAVSGLLAAAGAPADTVNVPLTFATNASNAIWNAADGLLNGSAAVANWLQDTANQLMNANNAAGEQINAWLGGLVGASSAAPAGASLAASTPASAQLSSGYERAAKAAVVSPRSGPHGKSSTVVKGVKGAKAASANASDRRAPVRGSNPREARG
ncbi:MAG: hypothetical protein ACOYEV_17175 [Candidatus Nanopelagicales bacterium]